jgi:hypothetical protein
MIPEKSISKKEANQNMIGKTVYVVEDGAWWGKIVDIIDEENFIVLKGGRMIRVNIFDIRSVD